MKEGLKELLIFGSVLTGIVFGVNKIREGPKIYLNTTGLSYIVSTDGDSIPEYSVTNVCARGFGCFPVIRDVTEEESEKFRNYVEENYSKNEDGTWSKN